MLRCDINHYVLFRIDHGTPYDGINFPMLPCCTVGMKKYIKIYMKLDLLSKLRGQWERCWHGDYRICLGLHGGRWGQSSLLIINRKEILTRAFRLHGFFLSSFFVIGKGEDSDVLSINADAYDSDIEGPCNEDSAAPEVPENTVQGEAGQIDDLEKDIEKSVNEILGLAESSPKEPKAATLSVPPPEDVQPSAQQLELLELEMRARAIKALMKAGDIKKPA